MVCEVFPAGSDDYEAMASLGRMVAQCGPGIEDIVRQRKPQDPSLWYEGSQRSTRLSPFPSIHFYPYQLLITLFVMVLLKLQTLYFILLIFKKKSVCERIAFTLQWYSYFFFIISNF